VPAHLGMRSSPSWSSRRDGVSNATDMGLEALGRSAIVHVMRHTQADVEHAVRHVKELESRVVEQRSGRAAEHQPTEAAENLLAIFQ
jgi:hypothetical protein